MIEARRLQRSFGDGLIAEEIEDLQEAWMRHVDTVLQDEANRLSGSPGAVETLSQQQQPWPAGLWECC